MFNAPLAGVVARPEPPLPTGNVPVTPVVSGKPVRLVAVPLDGVPKAPLNNTIAPAEPVFTPRAVATPVPKLVMPVPPFSTGNAVPDKVIANVPLLVIGEPATDKNVGTVAETLVTVPPLPVALMV